MTPPQNPAGRRFSDVDRGDSKRKVWSALATSCPDVVRMTLWDYALLILLTIFTLWIHQKMVAFHHVFCLHSSSDNLQLTSILSGVSSNRHIAHLSLDVTSSRFFTS